MVETFSIYESESSAATIILPPRVHERVSAGGAALSKEVSCRIPSVAHLQEIAQLLVNRGKKKNNKKMAVSRERENMQRRTVDDFKIGTIKTKEKLCPLTHPPFSWNCIVQYWCSLQA